MQLLRFIESRSHTHRVFALGQLLVLSVYLLLYVSPVFSV